MARGNVEFKIEKHDIKGHDVDVAEVFIGGQLVCTIYPSDNNGIRIMTRHLAPDGLNKQDVGAGVTMIAAEFRRLP